MSVSPVLEVLLSTSFLWSIERSVVVEISESIYEKSHLLDDTDMERLAEKNATTAV